MHLEKTLEKITAYTVQLTSYQDYESLTHHFLAILTELSWVTSAIAFEIYNHEKKVPGAATPIVESLLRRFPLDLSRTDDNNSNLLTRLDPVVDLNYGSPQESGTFNWVTLSVKGGYGPERAIFLEGTFDLNALNLLDYFRSLYRNLVILHDLKERDALTKLLNRQSLEARLLQVCNQYKNYQALDKQSEKSSWIAILDIDHFKRINDNFGHLFGDEVLLIFSQLMGKGFRYNDFIFRYGGEEFVVILNLVTENQAICAFNRFREAVAKYSFPTVGQVTVSIGVTHANNLVLPTTQLDQADKALYHAKKTGRNKVVLYENLTLHTEDKLSDIELF